MTEISASSDLHEANSRSLQRVVSTALIKLHNWVSNGGFVSTPENWASQACSLMESQNRPFEPERLRRLEDDLRETQFLLACLRDVSDPAVLRLRDQACEAVGEIGEYLRRLKTRKSFSLW